MPAKTPVKSWADLVSKAKQDGESLGDTMSRLSGTWGSVKDGSHPDYSYSPGAASSPARKKAASAPPARKSKKKRARRKVNRGGPQARKTRRRKRGHGKVASRGSASPGGEHVSRELTEINRKLDAILGELRRTRHSRS